MLTVVATISVNCQITFISIQMSVSVMRSLSAVSASETLTRSDNLTETVI